MTRVFISCSKADHDLSRALSSALREAGMEVWQIDTFQSGGDLQAEILSAIRRCDVFIAVFGNAHPNVMFELGCAIGSNATVLLIRRSTTQLLFDVSSLPTITVEPFDNRAIAKAVEWVNNVTIRVPSHDLLAGNPRQVLERLASDPTLLDEMEPRQFEEAVGRFLEYLRIPIEMGGSGPDLGYDFALRDFAGRDLVIVEVKKYNRNSRISLSEAQRLLGVATASGADGAIIVTSGRFTSSAKFFAESSPVKMVLLPFDELVGLTHEEVVRQCR